MKSVIAAVVLATLVGACTGDPSSGGEREFSVFDVDGVEVVAATAGGDLPEQATLVEFTTLVVDAGDGPGLCLTGADQCQEGIPLDGMSEEWWTEEQGEARWGVRTVVVEWSPDPDRLVVREDVPLVPDEEDFVDPSRVVPSECSDIDEFVSNRLVYAHQRTLEPAQDGGVYALNDGEIVLQVTDEPGPHRDALAVDGAEGCVVQVPYSKDEYRAMATDLEARLGTLLPYAGLGGGAVAGRIEVWVPVADRSTVARIAAEAEDPEALRVVGRAVILDGS